MTRPLLFWFGLDGKRLGILHVVGSLEHTEVIREEDKLVFSCVEVPSKYDRVLWWDTYDAVWREHYVRTVTKRCDGMYEVVAESVLFETRLDFVDTFRLEDASYTKVLDKVIPYTRFDKGTSGFGGVSSATAWIMRKSVLEALRKLEELYSIEFYVTIEVDEDTQSVAARKLCFCAEQGMWRGLRLVRGKNLDTGELVVCADEVITALYGYGASFGAYDEDGNATSGFTRRLTFGSENGGVDYVEDSRAKERYGRKGADGTYRNNFGHVIFPDVEKPADLYRKTHAALQELTQPKRTYVIDGEIDLTSVSVGFGDVVLVCDECADGPVRVGMRVVQRRRTFEREGTNIGTEAVTTKVRLGEIAAGARSHFATFERRCGKIRSFDEALVKAGLKEPTGPSADVALGVEIRLKSAKRVDGSDIDIRYTFAVATDDVYSYDVVVKNNLDAYVSGVAVSVPAAGVSESGLSLTRLSEKLYTVEVTPSAADVVARVFTLSATASCSAGNVGLASEYAACTVSASHSLPASTLVKPVNVIPSDLKGAGTFDEPYTVADLRRCVCVSSTEAALEDVWLCGYIVGFAAMDSQSGLCAETLRLGSTNAGASNIVLADSASETDVAKVCAVNLSTATKRRRAVRAALNLVDKPQMVGTKVWVLGDVVRYGGESGLKRVDEYAFRDASGQWHG